MGSTLISLIEPRADPAAALRPPAAERRRARVAADRQLSGAASAGLRRRRDAELLGDLQAAAFRAPRQIAGAADQGLEVVIAGIAVILVNRHRKNGSSGHPGRPRGLRGSGATSVFWKSSRGLSTPGGSSRPRRIVEDS